MRSLLSLLESAARRSASEVVLESGQPVSLTTARGPEREQGVLPGNELFDMIVAVIDDSQQVELVIGNPIEFTIEADGSWAVRAEPRADGMLVRAQREAPLELGIQLDDAFGLDDDHSFETGGFETVGSGLGSGGPPSQLRIEALEMPALREVAPAAPFESGTWALADEEEFDVGFDGPATAADLEVERESAHIGVPDDDDDDDDDDDPFGSLAGPPVARPTRALESRPTRSDNLSTASGGAATQRELRPLAAQLDPRRERPLPATNPSSGRSEPKPVTVAEGSLVYISTPGYAETLAESLAVPKLVVDDQSDLEQAWTRVRGLPVGAIVIVRREDPSPVLDAILRRLEEGYRVFVETRARTPEGARRILLGVGASARAERWLDSQVTLVVEPGHDGPRVRLST